MHYVYLHTHSMRADQNKNRGTRVIFFSWGRVGSVRGLFWGILLCEFNQIKFSRPLDPRICIHLQTTSKVCNCASSTCNNYCAKMFIYMYLHEDVILLRVLQWQSYLHFAFNKLVEMKCRHSKTNWISIFINVINHEFSPHLSSSMSITTLSIPR